MFTLNSGYFRVVTRKTVVILRYVAGLSKTKQTLKRYTVNTKEITTIAVNALEDLKGENIVVIDTTKMSSLFNAIIVCSGKSTRQVSALAHNVTEDFKSNGINIIGVEGKKGGEWVLVDSGDVVVHIMLPKVRDYYTIEELWNNDHSQQ